MENKKRFVVNMGSQILSALINFGINFFLSSYIVNAIGKEVYGFVGLANNFVSYVQIFTIALNAMLSRYVTIKLVKQEYMEANVYISSVSICNMIVSVILVFPTVLLSCFLQYIIDVPMVYMSDIKILWFLIFVAFLIQLASNTFQTCFFATNRLDLSAKLSLENYVLKAIILIAAFTFLKPHVWYVGVASVICAVFLSAINKHYMKKLTPWVRIQKSLFSLKAVKELVGVGVWNSVNQLSQLLLTGFDLLIANIFIGSTEMGILSIAKTIPTQILTFIGIVSNVFSPRMTMIYATGDKKALLDETSFSMRVCGAMCSVPVIGFIAFGNPFFKLWMSGLSDAELIKLQILSVLTLLPTVFSVYIYPLYNVNTITCKLRIPVLVSIGIGIGSLGIVYFLLKTTEIGIYAIAGVSSVLLMFRVLLFVPMYAAHNLKVKMWTFYPPLFRGLAASIIMLFWFQSISRLVTISTWMDLIGIAVISGSVGYIINYYIVFGHKERKQIRSMLKNLSRRKF